MGGFPVYRGEHDTWAMEHARKVLQSGQIVAMFPEGTRSRGKGLALAKPGAARLAIEENCLSWPPIYPKSCAAYMLKGRRGLLSEKRGSSCFYKHIVHKKLH